MPHRWFEHPGQSGDVEAVDVGDAKAQVAVGMGGDKIVVSDVSFAIVVAEYPAYSPSGGDRGGERFGQWPLAVLIAQKNDGAWRKIEARTDDGREVPMRVTGEQDCHDAVLPGGTRGSPIGRACRGRGQWSSRRARQPIGPVDEIRDVVMQLR